MATFQDTLRTPGTPDEQSFIAKRILATLTHQMECSLEDLIEICGSSLSNQVYLEVDRMNRTGEICLLSTKRTAASQSAFLEREIDAALSWHDSHH